MATGPQHYLEAERILGETTIDLAPILISQQLLAAQVHATLALAAAAALNDGDGGTSDEDYEAWRAVASVEVAEAQAACESGC